jgi:glycosyltransferase involved in cell wall biosynthesis
MKIAYRISDVGYNKLKPSYINNENCLRNAVKAFDPKKHDWIVLADGVSEETTSMIKKYISEDNIEHISIKNGPGYPFMHILDKLISSEKDDEIVYFLENDYLHKEGADVILEEGIALGAHYVTLYDHPDKYINASQGGNPFIENGGEITQVYLTKSCHWKLTNSTTGTFASTIKTLKEDYQIISKYANNSYLNDFRMFTELREQNRTLVSCIPGYSTHGETAWLTPLIDWSAI